MTESGKLGKLGRKIGQITSAWVSKKLNWLTVVQYLVTDILEEIRKIDLFFPFSDLGENIGALIVLCRHIWGTCKYHNLVYGPRSIQENLDILTELCKFTSLQVAWIGCVVRFTGALTTLNNAAMIFKWVIWFLDMLVWHDDVTSQYTRNGFPIKYDFIW